MRSNLLANCLKVKSISTYLNKIYGRILAEYNEAQLLREMWAKVGLFFNKHFKEEGTEI